MHRSRIGTRSMANISNEPTVWTSLLALSLKDPKIGAVGERAMMIMHDELRRGGKLGCSLVKG